MRYSVSISAPAGDIRVVRCADIEQAMDVIETEGRAAGRGALIWLYDADGTPVARWAKSGRGLVRGKPPRGAA